MYFGTAVFLPKMLKLQNMWIFLLPNVEIFTHVNYSNVVGPPLGATVVFIQHLNWFGIGTLPSLYLFLVFTFCKNWQPIVFVMFVMLLIFDLFVLLPNSDIHMCQALL